MCDRQTRYLAIVDDLKGAGLGFVSLMLLTALKIANARGRILVELPAETPRWCNTPPYTWECFYEKWTNCTARTQIARNNTVPFSRARSTDVVALLSMTKLWRSGLWRRGRHPHGEYPGFERDAMKVLFTPLARYVDEADRILQRCGMAERNYLTVHMRWSSEKLKETKNRLPTFRQYEKALPPNVSNVLWQTSNPNMLDAARKFAANATFRSCFTDEKRYTYDHWGGRNATLIGEASRIGVVNGYLGRQGTTGVLSSKHSMWTWFLLTGTTMKLWDV